MRDSPVGSPGSRPPRWRADIGLVVTLRPHTLLCVLAIAGSAMGQTPVPASDQPAGEAPAAGGERPRAAQRIVRVFDFEEQFTNALDLPAGWVRAQHDPLVPRDRPGFPIYDRARLEYEDPAHGGAGSVSFEIEGGSGSLRLNPGQLPIFPMGQYLIRASYRCEGLVHARPRLVVRALDGRGEVIPGSERSAVAEEIDGRWRELAVELPGKFPDAAYLQIDLEVVQPVEFRPERLPGHQVWEQDFDATVWFDDVVVAQMPQLSMRTGAALNVIARPGAPSLHTELRDLAAQDMTATIRVFDSRRELAASMERAITSGRVVWDWTPELDELGWYRAVVEIRSGTGLIASETCDFVLVAEPETGRRAYTAGPAFTGMATRATARSWRPVGIELTVLPPGSPEDLAGALLALGARTATVPVWSRDLTSAALPGRVDRLRDLVTVLREAWIEPHISLPVVPEALATPLRVGRGDVLDALSGDRASWEPYLLDALDRLGGTTARWQLGAAGSGDAAAGGDLAADAALAREHLASMVPGIELALGWRADQDPRQVLSSGAEVARVALPAWTSATPAETIVGPWLTAGSESGAAPEFVLEPLDTARHTEREVAADLARRTTELWARATAGVDGGAEEAPRFAVAIADPWRIEAGEEPTAHPTVGAGAWRALSDRLDGRTLAADWPVAPGVRCLVFGPPRDDPGRGGLIVAWNRDAPAGLARLHATLGDEPIVVYDIFGNGREVAPTESEDGTRLEHDLALGAEPVFIERINTPLVLFLAGIAVDPSEIESATGEHEHAITVTNPWDIPAIGRIVIASPGGYDEAAQARDRSWEITPRTLLFELGAGESARLPLVVSFARSIEAGPQRFEFDIELTADRDYGWLRAKAETAVVWAGIELDLTYRVPEGGAEGDVIIEATVTNAGDVARALEAIAYAPGLPRARSTIGTLEPGRTVVRRFPFEDAARALAGRRVVVSVSEAGGPGRLTKSLDLPGR